MKLISIPGVLALSFVVAACGGSGAAMQNEQNAVGPAANTSNSEYSAAGSVTAIAGDRVTISHGPVEGLGWPAMTMTFRADNRAMLQGVTVGDRVTFQFRRSGNDYPLTALSKAR